MFAFLTQRMEELQSVEDLLFGVVSDRTSVHEYSVGFFQSFACRITCHLHDRGNNFAVGHVHLASISFDKQLFVFLIGRGFKVRFRSLICHNVIN